MASFLFYFGVLTLKGLTDTGKLLLGIPNHLIQRLIREMVFDDSEEQRGEIEAAWNQEIRSRAEEIAEGRVETIRSEVLW